MEIISHKYVLIGNHSFDSRHHDMVFERAGKLLHSALDKSRGNGKNNNVGIGYHIIDVVEKLDFGGVENQRVEVLGILPVLLRIVDMLLLAEIPINLIALFYIVNQNTNQSSGPTSAAHYCYSMLSTHVYLSFYSNAKVYKLPSIKKINTVI